MSQRLTFKRDARVTGLAGIGADSPSVRLKLGGREFGVLKSPAASRLSSAPTDGWSVRLMVQRDSGDGWDWRSLKARFATEAEGREWLEKNITALQHRYNLRLAEED